MQELSKIHYWLPLYIYLCFSSITAIGDDFYQNKLNSCVITEAAINDYEPKKFQSINNLLRSTGKKATFCGTKIIITGRILDEACVPVSDAKVYLWQVGCDGKYPYQTLRNCTDTKLLNLSNDSSFTGSGIATSNNNGEFVFITIYPTALADDKPHVNFRVEHKTVGILQTKFYISPHAIVDSENIDSSLAITEDSTRIYNFDIVMPGRTMTRY
jgi:protocatechuate 3,4-dioxygenase beta subunit